MWWLAPLSLSPPRAISCPRCPVPRPCSGAVPMRRGTMPCATRSLRAPFLRPISCSVLAAAYGWVLR
eukprot:5139910-Pyramimonas_sp.AAC.1